MPQANSEQGSTPNSDNAESAIGSSAAAQQLEDLEEEILAKNVARVVPVTSEPTPDLPKRGSGVQERTATSGSSRDSLLDIEASILAKVSVPSQPDAKMDDCHDVEQGLQDPDDASLDNTKEMQSRQAENEIDGAGVDNPTHTRDTIIDSIMPLPSRIGTSTQATQPGAYAESGFGGTVDTASHRQFQGVLQKGQ